MRTQLSGPISVLIVEDNASDAEIVEEWLQDAATPTVTSHIRDGRSALDHLRATSEHPDLILLDLNLPLMGGLELLEEIKGDEALCAIPVLVLTTSKSSREILRCYERGAAAVLNKPMRLAGYREMLEAIERFWFQHVLLPRDEG